MTQAPDFDNSNGFTAGIYRQNAFYIRMSSFFDLEPSDVDPLPIAVAMHAHEYVHFLHNASTTAGQAYLLSNLMLLRAMAGGCDDQGYFLGPDDMTRDGREFLSYTATLMRVQLGSTSANRLHEFKDITRWKYGIPEIKEMEKMPSATAIFSAEDEHGKSQSQDVLIGLSFITEGIAYEVDREMRRLTGVQEEDLDKNISIFPYRSYRNAVRCWTGRDLQSEDLIAIGIAALAHQFSGFWLTEICNALKGTDTPLNEVLEKAISSCRNDSERVLAALQEQRKDLSKGDVIWTAMGEYMKLAENGSKLRQTHFAPELAFINAPLTPEDFRNRIGAMLDCLVIQEKPNNVLDMYWIGPGVIADTDRAASCLGALQSALHFNQLHLKADGSAVATTALANRPTSCPFAGGCETERNDKYPTDCKSAPWLRFTPSQPGEQVCWYAAGVKALRRPEKTSGEAR
ncbi:hypothetical protein [Burkholderia gladioli]|uniref:hypothetical protein n=1 Tax=Burkholderia gladioli TaxID=28095 RepID=UPI002FDF4483